MMRSIYKRFIGNSGHMTTPGDKLFSEPLAAGVVLNEDQIKVLVDDDQLIVKNYNPRGLDTCSYDIHMGTKGIIGGSVNERDLSESAVEVLPGSYAAVISLECVKIPDNILVRINTKRSIMYEGLVLLTGTQIDPGYFGYLLFGFYNASSRKRSLRLGRPICSLVFETLGGSVARPKRSDPDLVDGNFPSRFIDEMADMDVLSLHQISEHVKAIDRITKDILDLKQRYDDVLEPIKELTANVGALTVDVDKLASTVTAMNDQATRMENVAQSNQDQITQLIAETSVIKKDSHRAGEAHQRQDNQINELSTKFARFSLANYIAWAIGLVVVTAVLTWGLTKILDNATQLPAQPPAGSSAP